MVATDPSDKFYLYVYDDDTLWDDFIGESDKFSLASIIEGSSSPSALNTITRGT